YLLYASKVRRGFAGDTMGSQRLARTSAGEGQRSAFVIDRGGTKASIWRACSDVEPEMHHVSIRNDVIFPFHTKHTRRPRARFAFVRNVIAERDDLCANEAFLEVRVNDRRGLRRFPPALDGPRADFFRSGGKVADEPEHAVALVDHLLDSAFGHAVRRKELGALLVFHSDELGFDFGADLDD